MQELAGKSIDSASVTNCDLRSAYQSLELIQNQPGDRGVLFLGEQHTTTSVASISEYQDMPERRFVQQALQ